MHKLTRPERRRLARQSRKLEKKVARRQERFPRPKYLADMIAEKYILAVTSSEAAIYLGVTVQTICNLVNKGHFLRVARGLIDGPTLIEYKKATGGRRRRLGSQWEKAF